MNNFQSIFNIVSDSILELFWYPLSHSENAAGFRDMCCDFDFWIGKINPIPTWIFHEYTYYPVEYIFMEILKELILEPVILFLTSHYWALAAHWRGILTGLALDDM